MTATEITRIALKKGLLPTSGQTPSNTIYATLLRESKRGGPNAPVKVGSGFALPRRTRHP